MAAKKKRTTNSKTREEILERSILLFAKSGYNGVSMRDVAAAVRVTPAAIYYHFSGKEQLYLDTLRHALKEKASALNAALDGEEKPPWARLEAFVGALAQVLTQEKDFQRLLQWMLRLSPFTVWLRNWATALTPICLRCRSSAWSCFHSKRGMPAGSCRALSHNTMIPVFLRAT
jgi:AcrR family transcriptional regulator